MEAAEAVTQPVGRHFVILEGYKDKWTKLVTSPNATPGSSAIPIIAANSYFYYTPATSATSDT